MNKGKICISICAKTADELFKKIARAEQLADLIEMRFDCLDPSEIRPALARISSETELSDSLLATFRTLDQGGGRETSFEERKQFWTWDINKAFWGGDFEEDLIEVSLSANWRNRICSVHQDGTRTLDVDSAYERIANTGASVIKIATTTEEAFDGIPVWGLLKKAKKDNKPLIPIAMGEAGKWTRILGLAHGAFMTYASLETGSETAPGQISAEDMVNIFRVKELDKKTELYGIIAGDTSYSISPWMHNSAFKETGMNRVFVPLQTNDLDEFMRLMVDEETREVELNFRGFSVTNPHKRSIMEHLHIIDETATKIGAVNTVKIEDGQLFGYNTDAPGFIAPLKKVLGDVKGARVAIAGAGGAARACAYALKQEGANVTIFARRHRRAEKLAEEFGVNVGNANNSFRPGTVDILVNATPLGTKGGEMEATIATASQMNGIKLVYDLVYNPIQTRLIREARIAGVAALGGLDMVLAQGRKQFEIWTGDGANQRNGGSDQEEVGVNERYSRQVLFDEIGKAGQETLLNSRVLIVGCGALGASHAEMLARAGVGKLRIVDRDFVEFTNLQRQTLFSERDAAERLPKAIAAKARIGEINSEIEVEAIVTDVNNSNVESFLEGCDLVLDGTDNFQVRYLLNDACVKHGKTWIYGAAVSSYGTTMTIIPGETPCLRCIFEEMPDAGSSPTCDTAGVIMPIISSVSSVQITEAIKLLVGKRDELHGSLMQIDVWANDWRKIKLSGPQPECPVCGKRNFEFLDAESAEFAAVLCGRNAVQIAPPRSTAVDLNEISQRLAPLSEVKRNDYLVRFSPNGFEMTIFADGRAIIRGTEDISVARSLYAKYVGN